MTLNTAAYFLTSAGSSDLRSTNPPVFNLNGSGYKIIIIIIIILVIMIIIIIIINIS